MAQPVWIPSPDEIKKLRLRAKISQRELARRAGVSQSLIARLEKGEVNIRLSTLQKILRVLYEALADEEKAAQYMNEPVIVVRTDTIVKEIIEIMDKHGISQIPVLDDNGRVVGTVYESTLLKLLVRNGQSFLTRKAAEVMDEPLPQVSPNTPIYIVEQILLQYPAVLVVDSKGVKGIITKIDLLRRQLQVQHRVPS